MVEEVRFKVYGSTGESIVDPYPREVSMRYPKVSCQRIKSFKSLKSFNLFSTMKSSHSKISNVLVPIANGTEEIEATTIIDTLVRGGAVSIH